ncbi:MAG: hypothetical protein AABW99_02015 [archaeon]
MGFFKKPKAMMPKQLALRPKRMQGLKRLGVAAGIAASVAVGGHFAAGHYFGKGYAKRIPIAGRIIAARQPKANVFLSTHEFSTNLEAVEKTLQNAERQGKPYNVVFFEDGGIRIGEKKAIEKYFNERAARAKEFFKNKALAKMQAGFDARKKEIAEIVKKIRQRGEKGGPGNFLNVDSLFEELNSDWKKEHNFELIANGDSGYKEFLRAMIGRNFNAWMSKDSKADFELLKKKIDSSYGLFSDLSFYRGIRYNLRNPAALDSEYLRNKTTAFEGFVEERTQLAGRHGLTVRMAESYSEKEIERMNFLRAEMQRFSRPATPEEERTAVKAEAEWFWIRDSRIGQTIAQELNALRRSPEFKGKKVNALVILGASHYSVQELLDRETLFGSKILGKPSSANELTREAIALSRKGLKAIRDY